jgi:hypothetical protein
MLLSKPAYTQETQLERFNMAIFNKLLAEETDPVKRLTILRFLATEEKKSAASQLASRQQAIRTPKRVPRKRHEG